MKCVAGSMVSLPRLLVLALALVGAFLIAPARAEAPAGTWRLDDVVGLARQHRAEVAAARARARAAGHRPKIVSALEDPVIAPSIDHLPFMLHGIDVSVTIEQSFPLSRIRGNRARAAEAEARARRADVDRTVLEIELDVTQAFVMLQEERQMARFLAEQQDLAAQLVRAATARYGAGKGTQSEVLRAEIEVARLDGELRATRAEVRAAEAMLNTAIGRDPAAAVPALDAGVLDALPPDAAAVRARARDRRPELRAGQADIERAQAEIAVMRSMYAPMAMVRTGPAYTMTDGAGWMIMIGVSIPLWRGKLRAGVAEARAMEDMARHELVAMQRMTEGEAVVARERVVAARERWLALRDQVLPKARGAIDPALAGYASGQLPLVSVLEAAGVLWSTQAELAMAERELGAAWARLRRALGGLP